MSLYGDLPQAKDDAVAGSKSWTAANAKMQPPGVRKPGLAPPAALLRAGVGGGRGPGPAGRVLPAPSAGRGRGRGSTSAGTPAENGIGGSGACAGPSVVDGSSGGDGGGGSGPIVVSALSFFSTHGEPIQVGTGPTSKRTPECHAVTRLVRLVAAGPTGLPPDGLARHPQRRTRGPGSLTTDSPRLSPPPQDEYDPARPNDYEDVLRERDRKRREAEEEAERVKRAREADMVRGCGDRGVGAVGTGCGGSTAPSRGERSGRSAVCAV